MPGVQALNEQQIPRTMQYTTPYNRIPHQFEHNPQPSRIVRVCTQKGRLEARKSCINEASKEGRC